MVVQDAVNAADVVQRIPGGGGRGRMGCVRGVKGESGGVGSAVGECEK